jgi:hypothetical protein
LRLWPSRRLKTAREMALFKQTLKELATLDKRTKTWHLRASAA